MTSRCPGNRHVCRFCQSHERSCRNTASRSSDVNDCICGAYYRFATVFPTIRRPESDGPARPSREVRMNPADTVWMLISTALVLLMTPALAFFYGGLVRP